jgi:hypothetical protein
LTGIGTLGSISALPGEAGVDLDAYVAEHAAEWARL